MSCGVTGIMVNSLEMIIKFSNELVKVHGMEIPPQMTWMDGLEKGDPCNSSQPCYALWIKNPVCFNVLSPCIR